jgi:hypothetical protein
MGDQYVFVAMDAETKVIPCFRVGKRNTENTWYFIQDLESRLANRPQLTTDGWRAYIPAVEDAFGAEVDYAMLVKMYGKDPAEPYAPAQITSALPIPVTGDPKPETPLHFHVPRRTAKPDDSDATAAVHAPDECFLEEAGEPEGRLGFALRLV